MKWERKKALSDIAIAQISQYLTQFILFFRNFIFAKFLGPVDFGIYASIFLFFSYGNYSNLGVVDGISRIVPYQLGAGEDRKARDFLGAGFWGLNFITSVFSVSIIVYSLLSPFKTIQENRFSVILTSIAILLNQNFTYVLTYLRMKHNFKKSYLLQLFQAILDLTLSIILMLKFKVLGIFLGAMLSFLILTLTSIKDLLSEVKPRFDLGILKEILNVGFQILIVGFTYGFLMSADKFSIANLFEKQKMGIYSVAVGLGVLPYFASATLGQFIGQRMLEEYGKTKSKDTLKIFLDESLLAIAFITPIISILTITFAEPFIQIFLPKYIESLRYVDKLAIAYYFLSLGAILGTFLITINQQKMILLLNLFLIPIVLLLNFFAFKNGFDLLGISYVTFLNFSGRTFFLFLLSYKNYYDLYKAIKTFFKFSIPSFPIFLVFAVKFLNLNVYQRIGIRFAFAILFLIVAIIFLSKKTQIVSYMIELMKERIVNYFGKITDLFI